MIRYILICIALIAWLMTLGTVRADDKITDSYPWPVFQTIVESEVEPIDNSSPHDPDARCLAVNTDCDFPDADDAGALVSK